MVKHVILWKLHDHYSPEKKEEIKIGIKNGLESLKGKIPGLVDIHVLINGMETSNADAMLEVLFTDESSLKGYGSHPEHVKIADTFVRPHTQTRLCLDFEEPDAS